MQARLFGGPADGETFTIDRDLNAIAVPVMDGPVFTEYVSEYKNPPLPDISFTEVLYREEKACVGAWHPCVEGVMVYHVWRIHVCTSVDISKRLPPGWAQRLLRIPPDKVEWLCSYLENPDLSFQLQRNEWKLTMPEGCI